MFDNITPDDLIIAFFPCIYFCAASQMSFYLSCKNYINLSDEEKIREILKRSEKRQEFYNLLIKLCAVCMRKGLKLIIENPWSEQTYLKSNFIKIPDLVDTDRTLRGDYFKKPTAYFYFNCKPTWGTSYQDNKDKRIINKSRKSKTAGICSEERSMISSDYARNFICDFILGKKQDIGQQSLF